MTKHIHIHLHKTKDSGPAHAPAGSSKGGQFVAGSGGGSSGNGKGGLGHLTPAERAKEVKRRKDSIARLAMQYKVAAARGSK